MSRTSIRFGLSRLRDSFSSWGAGSSALLRVLLALGVFLPAASAHCQTIGPEVRVTYAGRPENEPAVAALAEKAVAIWFRNLQDNAISWGYSNDAGSSWKAGGNLPFSASNQGPLFHPSLTVDGAGDFYALAVLGDNVGWTLALWRGSFQGNAFQWQPLIYTVPSTFGYVLAYDAPRVTCDPDNGNLYVTYTRAIRFSANPLQYQYQINLVRSLDHGATWSTPLGLSSINCNGSRAAVGPNGELYVIWEDFGTRQVLGRKSIDSGATFGSPFILAPILDNLGMPPPGWYPELDRANPAFPNVGFWYAPDFPALAVDRSSGPHRGSLYATWTDYASGTVDPPTSSVGDKNPNSYFGNATPVVIGQDIVGHFPWVEFSGGDCDMFTFLGTAGQTIQISGSIFNACCGYPDLTHPVIQDFTFICGPDTTHLVALANGEIQESPGVGLPAMIYTLPFTGRYYINMGCGASTTEDYMLSLRELHLSLGQVARDHRDVVLVSSGDGGQTWSSKKLVNDDPPGFDNCFPDVAVDGLGQVHVAWYDRHDVPDQGMTVHTYWALSRDGGGSFLPSQRLSGQPSPWQYSGGGPNIGDHLGLATAGARTFVVWTQVAAPDTVDIHGVTITTDPATGTTIARFVVEPGINAIALSWLVADASELLGFRVERAQGDAEFESLAPGLIPSHGVGDYSYQDEKAESGVHYRYRLAVLTSAGTSYEGPLEATLQTSVKRLALSPKSNPFHTSLALTLALPREVYARVHVYDLQGHLVADVHDGVLTAGEHVIEWNGKDRSGGAAGAGLYLVRAEAGGQSVSRRVIRIQ
jgi:FlgD Ig-like domain